MPGTNREKENQNKSQFLALGNVFGLFLKYYWYAPFCKGIFMEKMPKLLIIIGILFIFAGLFYQFGGKYFPLGKLPGDIIIKKGNSTFYFPLTTCILISAILSLIFGVLKK